MATTIREIVHVRRLLADFGVFLTAPTPLTCDNQSAIKIVTNPVFHERTKHIEIDCYFTRQHFTSVLYHSYIFAQRSILQTSLRSHIIQRE